jgi:hypothetical protein
MFTPKRKSISWILAICLGLKLFVIIVLSLNLNILYNANLLPVIISHDAISYLKAAHNIAHYRTYSLSDLPHEETVYFTGRMGGYEMLIAIFLFFTSERFALLLVVCLQVVFSVLSLFALAHIAGKVFKSHFTYWCTLFLYSSNTYVAVLDLSILSESLAVSFSIISIYFLIQNKLYSLHYFLSGLLITSAIFFRPYLILILPVMIIYILFNRSIHIRRLSNQIRLLFFLIPFLVCETAWTIRNYYVTDKFVPFVSDLHAQIDYPSGFKSLMSFVQSWGGDIVWWNPKAEIVAFMQNPSVTNVTNKYSSIDHLPKYIYTPAYNHDSLNRIKGLLAIEGDTSLSQSIRNQSGQEASLLLDDYRKSFVNTKPIHYSIYAPLRLLSNFIFHSGTYNIASKPYYNMTIPEKFYKIFYSGLYIFTLFAGLMSIIYCLSFKRNSTIILIAYVGLLMIFLCPFVLRRIEYRYFVLCYPFLTVFAAYFIWQISNLFNQIKTKKKLTT